MGGNHCRARRGRSSSTTQPLRQHHRLYPVGRLRPQRHADGSAPTTECAPTTEQLLQSGSPFRRPLLFGAVLSALLRQVGDSGVVYGRLAVFDIRNPENPRPIAYFIPAPNENTFPST